MTTLVISEPGVGTSYTIKKTLEMIGVQYFPMIISHQDLGHQFKALHDIQSDNEKRVALVLDLGSDINSTLLSSVLEGIESKTFAGFNMPNLAGVVVVGFAFEQEEILRHPISSGSMLVQMPDVNSLDNGNGQGIKARVDEFHKRLESAIIADFEKADIAMHKSKEKSSDNEPSV